MAKKSVSSALKKKVSAESGKKTKNRPKKSGKKRIGRFKTFLTRKSVCRVALVAGAAAFLYVGYCGMTMPDITQAVNASRVPKITVLASDGSELASYGAQYGRPAELSKLPPYVAQAVIATEDIRFYKHFGVDPRSVLRALVMNIMKGRKAQGASTLTQQVAKNLFLSSKKTMKRKIQELMLSFWLEYKLTKEQILTIYLNRVYFGAGTYGIEAAARRYYGISAEKLNLYQAAVLAGLLKAPSNYNPLTRPGAANKRARIVLANMAKAGFITARDGLNAAETGAAAGRNENRSFLYFTDWIADETESYLGSVGQDIRIITTLNPQMQQVLDGVIKETLDEPETKEKNVTQAAGVIMSHEGAVLAMVGGRDYRASQFNRATEARRQIGSAIKPFVYLAAFEKGMRPSDIVEDKPLSLNGWSPKNATGRYYGEVSLHEALVQSLNTVAVATAVKTGVRHVLKTARKFGIVSGDCEANGAVALGVCETRLIDAVSAYAALANGGIGVTPFGISEIIGADGEILYQRSDGGRSRLINPRYVAELDAVLIDVIQSGTGKKANPSVLAKGKTGTTQNYRDAWFVGYTQEIAAGIWVGNDDEKPMRNVSGGSIPAQIWGKTIREISIPQM